MKTIHLLLTRNITNIGFCVNDIRMSHKINIKYDFEFQLVH